MMALSNVMVSLPPSFSSTASVLASANLRTRDLGDLVLFHQEVHAGDAALGDLAAPVVGDPIIEGRLAAMPKVLASLVKMCASSALRSSALDGMQPTLRQTPPSISAPRPRCSA